MKSLKHKLVGLKGYENLEELLGCELGSLLYKAVDLLPEIEKSGFIQGIGYSISFLKGSHGLCTEVEDLFKESGYSLKEFEDACDDYDIKYIKMIAETNQTKRSLN